MQTSIRKYLIVILVCSVAEAALSYLAGWFLNSDGWWNAVTGFWIFVLMAVLFVVIMTSVSVINDVLTEEKEREKRDAAKTEPR